MIDMSIIRDACKKGILTDYEINAIAIGGSYAREYEGLKSDIDLLYFISEFPHYKKRKLEYRGYQFEFHYIPDSFADEMIKAAAPILFCRNQNDELQCPSNELNWGEKRCALEYVDAVNDVRNINSILSAWRELRKLLDTIIIFDNNSWYSRFKYKYDNFKIDNNKLLWWCDKTYEDNLFSQVEKLCLFFKFNCLSLDIVYSKSYWTNYYLNLPDNSFYKQVFSSAFSISSSLLYKIVGWRNILKSKSAALEAIHNKLGGCRICHGKYASCNLGRCISDYIQDIDHAIESRYFESALLCENSCYKYIKRLISIHEIKLNDIIDDDWVNYWLSVNSRISSMMDDVYLFSKGRIENAIT